MQTINLTLNDRMSVQITADHERDAIKQISFWLSLPEKCPKCGSSISFNYRTPQKYEYWELICNGSPRHSVNLGVKQGTLDLYYDQKKTWQAYNPTAIDDPAADPEPATPATTGPAFAKFDNSPDSPRGKMIKKIKMLHDECRSKGLTVSDVNLNTLGGQPDDILINIGKTLKARIDRGREIPT